jgi:hypothetical protein
MKTTLMNQETLIFNIDFLFKWHLNEKEISFIK